MMHITPEVESQIKAWIKDLRSGKFKQGDGLLHNSDKNTFCCLGVACTRFVAVGELNGREVPSDVRSRGIPDWIGRVNSDFRRKVDAELDLMEMNDSDEFYIDGAVIQGVFTFDEIADMLELVYIHEALE